MRRPVHSYSRQQQKRPPSRPNASPWRTLSLLATVVFTVTTFGASTFSAGAQDRPPQPQQKTQGFGVQPESPYPAQPKVRRLEANRAGVNPRPIAEELRTDDEVLEIEDWMPVGQAPPPEPGTSTLEKIAKSVPLALLVKVKSTVSRLSAAGDWVNTDVTAEVVQPLKVDPRSALTQSGQSITFQSPGGEMMIGRTRVRTFRTGTTSFIPGSTYLVLIENKDGAAWVSAFRAALVDGDKLVAMSKDSRTIFESFSKEAAVSAISALPVIKH